jgi:TolA-binding protein
MASTRPQAPATTASADAAGSDAMRLGRAAMEQSLGNPRGVIENLEAIDLETPGFTEADRAAFLLGQAYLRIGSVDRFVALARRVSAWKRTSVYTQWLAYQLLIEQTQGAAPVPPARPARATAPSPDESETSAADSTTVEGATVPEMVGWGAADALAASLRLAQGDTVGALGLLSRVEERAEAPALKAYLRAVTQRLTGVDDEHALIELSSADTTTALGRDLAGAALVRRAALALARGVDARPLLEAVPSGSRYAARAQHLRGLIAIERGDTTGGVRMLEALAADSTYEGRREVELAIAAQALDEGRWDAAHDTYRRIDQDWTHRREVLERIRAGARFDELWTAWDRGSANADALFLDALPARLLADQLATASADLRSRGTLEAPALAEAPPPPDSLTAIPPPPADARRAVAAADARAEGARYELARVRRSAELERASLEDLRRYLALGVGHAARARDSVLVQVRLLDSLQSRLDGLDAELRAVRDHAKVGLAARAALVIARADQQRTWIESMRRLDLVVADSARNEAPPGMPSADSLTRAEETLARGIAGFAQRLSDGLPDLLDRSYQHAWRPHVIDRAASSRLEAHRLQAWADALGPSIQGAIAAAASSESLRALDARARQIAPWCDSLDHADQALRAQVARQAVEGAIAALDSEREAIDYGLAAALYARSVHLSRATPAEPDTADTSDVALATPVRHDSASAGAGAEELDDAETIGGRREAIAALQTFLGRHPASTNRGEMRFRLADLLLLDARQSFRERMAAYLKAQSAGRAAGMAVPVVDRAPALALYRKILAEDRDFAHLDAVLFNAGMLLADEGDPAADRFFQQLVDGYPESRYMQEATLRMGDLRFDQARFADAIPLYRRAANGTDPSLQAIALYKMGWAYFNEERLPEAADAFRAVLDVYETRHRGRINVDIEGEAEAYLVHALARSGGAEAFASHFDRVGPRPYERRVLRALGQHFRRYSLFDQAAAADQLYLRRYPLDPEALISAQRLPETYERWDRPALARQARLDVAPLFAPGSAWAAAQTSDSVRTAGAEFARASWRTVALDTHRAARTHGSADDWRETLRLYQLLIAHWPKDDETPAYELGSGEACARLGDYQAALRHDRVAADAGNDSLAAAALVHRVAVNDLWYESTRDTTRHGAQALGRDSLARAVLTAGDELRMRFPAHPAGGDVLWRQGNLAFAHGWLDTAAADFARLVARRPPDARAPQAAGLEADAWFRLGRFDAAGVAFETTLAIARRSGRADLEKRAAESIPVCYYRDAEALAARDSTAYQEQAQRFEQVAARWPSYEHAPLAEYRAGLAWLHAGKTREGVRALQKVISDFPRSDYVKDAHLEIARTWESSGDRAAAANAYVAFADRYPNDESAGSAWLKAAELDSAAGLTAKADTLRLAYLHRFPGDVETGMQILEGFARRDLAQVTPEHSVATLLPKGGAATDPTPSHLAEYLRLAKAHPELASPAVMAQVRFLEAEQAWKPYAAVRLVQPLQKSIPVKQRMLDSLVARYKRCVDLGASEWANAATFRIGQALIAFGEALEGSDRPADLQGDDRRAYDEVLLQQSQTFYDRGEGVWAELLRQKGATASDPWIAQARTLLWHRLGGRFYFRPEADYPLIAGAEPETKSEPHRKHGSAAAADSGATGTVHAQREEDRP